MVGTRKKQINSVRRITAHVCGVFAVLGGSMPTYLVASALPHVLYVEQSVTSGGRSIDAPTISLLPEMCAIYRHVHGCARDLSVGAI
jgi:hypothetical protein